MTDTERVHEGEPTVEQITDATDRLEAFRDRLDEEYRTRSFVTAVVRPSDGEPIALVEGEGESSGIWEVVRVLDEGSGHRTLSWFERPEGVCRLVCLARAIGELAEHADLDREVLVHVLEGIGMAGDGTHPGDLLNFYEKERVDEGVRLLSDRPIRTSSGGSA